MTHIKESFYFSHDTNAFLDPKIRVIVSEFGIMAYGIWWVIIEMLSTQKDYKIRRDLLLPAICPMIQGRAFSLDPNTGQLKDENNAVITPDDAVRLRTTYQQLNAIYMLMEKVALLRGCDAYIWSDSLIDRMNERTTRSDRARSSALRRWQREKDSEEYQSDNQGNIALLDAVSCNAIKENKIKESKVYKKRDNGSDLDLCSPKHLSAKKEPLLSWPIPEDPGAVWMTQREWDSLVSKTSPAIAYKLCEDLETMAKTQPAKYKKYKDHKATLWNWHRWKLKNGFEWFDHPQHGPDYYKSYIIKNMKGD